MAELFSELIELLSEALAVDGGLAAVYSVYVLIIVFVFPFMLMDVSSSLLRCGLDRRRAAACFARYRSETSTVCRVRSCPHAAGCQFYEKRPSLWSRLKLWIQKKKNSRE